MVHTKQVKTINSYFVDKISIYRILGKNIDILLKKSNNGKDV
jgi:hypothetical protein